MDVNALRRRIVALRARRARLCEAYGLWAGAKLTPRQRQRLARLARAIKRLSARAREMGAE
jgi:hypothetical protein